MRGSLPRDVLAGVVAGVAATGAWRVWAGSPGALDADRRSRWDRRNFRDREVSLRLGSAVGLGAVAGVLASPAPGTPAGRHAVMLVVSSAALVGTYDDLYGDRHARGLGGHLRALRDGRVTTGLIKLVVLTTSASVASRRTSQALIDSALGTVLVAGSANLVNLLDLRPGRAAKVSAAAAATALAVVAGNSGGSGGSAGSTAAIALGVSLAALPADLGERGMLGDAGAGVLGSLVGWSAAQSGSRRRRAWLATSVVALTMVSERVSFSEVIDRTPALRTLDQLGRQA